MVGLEAAANRPVGEYSAGMQRRIGLAQALVNDPQLLILDEPTAGLDPIGTRQIKDLILELRHRGKTILLCSHLLADVEDVCDRVAIMFGGRIRASGPVDDLLIQSGMTTLHTNYLDEEAISEIERVLEARGCHIEKVEQPRQKLESLFLDVVHKAQAEGAHTHGARSGSKIADFLVHPDREQAPAPGRGSAPAPNDAADVIIRRLMQPPPPQVTITPPPTDHTDRSRPTAGPGTEAA